MKNLIKTLIVSIAALASGAEATLPTQESPLLAKITQSAGYMFQPSNGKIYSGSIFEILEDGKVFVSKRYHLNGKEILERTQPLEYKLEDIRRYKNSITQLKADRLLVEDIDGPIICDGGSTHYKVMLGGVESTLEESNDCRPGKRRQGRSLLEIKVIRVMKDLLDAYYALDQ